jgi:hypothetical protein
LILENGHFFVKWKIKERRKYSNSLLAGAAVWNLMALCVFSTIAILKTWLHASEKRSLASLRESAIVGAVRNLQHIVRVSM